MRILCLFLLSLACAAPSTPTTYGKGTYVSPPPAPTARPGVGLRIPGQPQRQVDVQPNPRPKRYLPPSREPGIWASDTRRWDDPAPTIKVLDVEIPMPPEAKTALDVDMASRCAYIMDLGVRTHALTQTELARRPQSARCIAALAFHFCAVELGHRAKEMWDAHEQEGVLTNLGRQARNMVEPVKAASLAFVARECGMPPPEWTRALSPAFYEMMHNKAPKVMQ